MHFGISYKPTYRYNNNAGLISKVSKEIAIGNAENCRCRQPNCRLKPSAGTRVVVLEESPRPRGSSRTNLQVIVLVLVLGPKSLSSSSRPRTLIPRKFSRTLHFAIANSRILGLRCARLCYVHTNKL